MSFFSYAWDWVTTSANWHGSGSIPQQILAHLGYSVLPLLIAALIGIPAGVAIGHTGRGAVLVVNLANAWRAIPTLGLLILLAVYLGFSSSPGCCRWSCWPSRRFSSTPTRAWRASILT